MKKLLFGAAIFMTVVFAASAFGVGSAMTMSLEKRGYQDRFAILTVLCTGDSVTGAFPNSSTDDYNYRTQTITKALDGWLAYQIKAIPGGTGPTAASDLVILDGDGIDILGSVDGGTTPYRGLNFLLNTLTSKTYFDLYNVGQAAHQSDYPVVDSKLTFYITNSTAASATLTLKVYFFPYD